jgi:hypothetical protein
MKTLKIVGFFVFIGGAVLHLWWLVVLGWIVYEAGGVTWMAAATSNEHGHGNHLDHGPMN